MWDGRKGVLVASGLGTGAGDTLEIRPHSTVPFWGHGSNKAPADSTSQDWEWGILAALGVP